MIERKVTQVLFPNAPLKISDALRRKRVAAYARVSTGSDEQQMSLNAQKDYFKNYIRQNPEWIYAGLYYDDGISGLSSKNRDGFNQMITDALHGHIDLIVTKSLSRFARNTVDLLSTIRLLKDSGIGVYFEKEDILTLDSKGEFMITLISTLAQEESRNISENVTWGIRKRFSDGKYQMPYKRFLGYDRSPAGEPVINGSQARIVRQIYMRYLEGWGITPITHSLSDCDIPAPGGGVRWHTTTVESILQNIKYKGDALLQKTFTTNFLTKEKKENEGELPQYYVTGGHEAIIPPEIFDLATQVQLHRKNTSGHYITLVPLSRKIICQQCGSSYGRTYSWTTHNGKRYNHSRWVCRNRGKKLCNNPTVPRATLTYNMINILFDTLLSNWDVLIDCYSLLPNTATFPDMNNFLQFIKENKQSIFSNEQTWEILVDYILVDSTGSISIVLIDGSNFSVDIKRKGT